MKQKQPSKTKGIEESRLLQHCLQYQKIYLLLLFFLLSGMIISHNISENKPLFTGAESYYHLTSSQAVSWKTAYYYPLHVLEEAVGSNLLIIFSLCLTITTLLIIWHVFKKIELSLLFTGLFSLFLILTPAFMKSATTLSSAMVFLFLFSLSFFFFFQKKPGLRYCSIITSILLACLDQWSALFAFFIFLLYALKNEKTERRVIWGSIIALLTSLLFTSLVSKIPFILGPFHASQLARDLISDFGGFSGMSFFIAALALIGFIISWPKRTAYALPYLSLPLLIPAYVYNTETILPLSIVFIFFATEAVINLIKRQWQLPTLQQFTLFLLLLGIIFSSLTFISRLETASPTHNDLQVLQWMKDDLTSSIVVATFPEDAAYVHYLAEKDTFFASYDQDAEREKENTAIISATYIHQLFPLLEKNKIEYIYLSEAATRRLPPDQGLPFLFQNERFKLLYSAGGSAIWKFGPQPEGIE
ncbi:hypothetical protein HYT55_01885 [Candidatus Woesearchaeota archaeon]|nr:hypothetical protein [Candidatus Woesearchaeota archaeon]